MDAKVTGNKWIGKKDYWPRWRRQSNREAPIVPPMATVANAIQDAVGLRLDDLPMSPPKMLAALGENS